MNITGEKLYEVYWKVRFKRGLTMLRWNELPDRSREMWSQFAEDLANV